MQVTLHSTSKTVELENDGQVMPARVWEGYSANGVPVIAFITRMATPIEGDHTEFERDLADVRPPSAEVQAWPDRMIL